MGVISFARAAAAVQGGHVARAAFLFSNEMLPAAQWPERTLPHPQHVYGALCSQQLRGGEHELDAAGTPLCRALRASGADCRLEGSAFQSLSNDGSGWRDEHESEAPDPAMLAICDELIIELEARANCS
jgi:hypothetical protein